MPDHGDRHWRNRHRDGAGSFAFARAGCRKAATRMQFVSGSAPGSTKIENGRGAQHGWLATMLQARHPQWKSTRTRKPCARVADPQKLETRFSRRLRRRCGVEQSARRQKRRASCRGVRSLRHHVPDRVLPFPAAAYADGKFRRRRLDGAERAAQGRRLHHLRMAAADQAIKDSGFDLKTPSIRSALAF